jgi:hypothetical protein
MVEGWFERPQSFQTQALGHPGAALLLGDVRGGLAYQDAAGSLRVRVPPASQLYLQFAFIGPAFGGAFSLCRDITRNVHLIPYADGW